MEGDSFSCMQLKREPEMNADVANVAHLVRASGCGSEGRGFDPLHSPHRKNSSFEEFFLCVFVVATAWRLDKMLAALDRLRVDLRPVLNAALLAIARDTAVAERIAARIVCSALFLIGRTCFHRRACPAQTRILIRADNPRLVEQLATLIHRQAASATCAITARMTDVVCRLRITKELI